MSPTAFAIALSFVAPLSIDAVLPSFEQIKVEFGANLADTQKLLSSYLLAYALMSLWHGFFADRFGRRVTAICSLVLYSLASLSCAASSTLQSLEASRFAQGAVAGTGVVVARALIRDQFQGADAQRRLSIISMMLALPPALGPIAGGWLAHQVGWRSVFLALAAMSLLLLLTCIFAMHETQDEKHRLNVSASTIIRNYTVIFSNRQFLILVGAATLCLSGQFLTIAGAPTIVVSHFKGNELDYWVIFLPITFGIFVGGFLSSRLSKRIAPSRQVMFGFLLMMTSSVFDNIVAKSNAPLHVLTFIPYTTYAMGMIALLSVAYAQTLAEFPGLAGMVSSCQLFMQSIAISFVSWVMVPLLDSFVALVEAKLFLTLLALSLWMSGGMAQRRSVPGSDQHQAQASTR